MSFWNYIPPEILFQIGSFTVYTYSVLLGVAIVLGYFITLYLARQYEKVLDRPLMVHVDYLFFWLLVFGIIASRLFYVFYNIDFFITQPWEVLALWHGGWVWHGAFLAGIVVAFVYCRRHKLPFWLMVDMISPGLVLGQAIGRWGNYFNQEAYGLPTHLAWGIPIEFARRATGYEGFSQFHPTFLYESVFSLVLFIVLFIATRVVLFRLAKNVKKEARFMHFGVIFLGYAVVYSLGRFLIEFLRIDLVPVFAGLRLPQWICLAIILAGIILIAGRLLHDRRESDTLSL
ncbi:MAG: prolipoprotein diacylglyceryl transferase [bacterium]|nr:prolipoprotein diacylglyceryl transferase [bacterium]